MLIKDKGVYPMDKQQVIVSKHTKYKQLVTLSGINIGAIRNSK